MPRLIWKPTYAKAYFVRASPGLGKLELVLEVLASSLGAYPSWCRCLSCLLYGNYIFTGLIVATYITAAARQMPIGQQAS